MSHGWIVTSHANWHHEIFFQQNKFCVRFLDIERVADSVVRIDINGILDASAGPTYEVVDMMERVDRLNVCIIFE